MGAIEFFIMIIKFLTRRKKTGTTVMVMQESNASKLAILVFLVLPSILWVIWSFKMTTSFNDDKGFTYHKPGTILGAGVCPLGKFGAWVIFIWSCIMIIVLGFTYKTNDASQIDKVNKIVGYINAFIMGIIFILSLVMNTPLFIRTFPFFFTQIAITMIILHDLKEF